MPFPNPNPNPAFSVLPDKTQIRLVHIKVEKIRQYV